MDEKKAEYLEKRRISRQKRKTAALTVNVDEAEPSAHMVSPGVMQMGSRQSCITQRMPTPNVIGMEHMGSGQTSTTEYVKTPSTERSHTQSENDDISWLHRNDTYHRPTTTNRCSVTEPQSSCCSIQMSAKQSYVEPDQRTASEKKRQRAREHYSKMTVEQMATVLQRNRDNKKAKLTNATLSHPSIINLSCTTPLSPSRSIPAMQGRSKYNPTDNLDSIQEEQTISDDDEESRIFRGQGDVFDSWRVTSGVAPSTKNVDPYDYVYHNLPWCGSEYQECGSVWLRVPRMWIRMTMCTTIDHVLKPVQDCEHRGAIRFQYEGPAFCCRKGKVKIVTPAVPDELRRLFTSQVDADAKYFRKHISNMSGFFVLKYMRSWNGKEVAWRFVKVSISIPMLIKCKCEIFMTFIHNVCATYKDNECRANIPQVVLDLVNRIRIDYFL